HVAAQIGIFESWKREELDSSEGLSAPLAHGVLPAVSPALRRSRRLEERSRTTASVRPTRPMIARASMFDARVSAVIPRMDRSPTRAHLLALSLALVAGGGLLSSGSTCRTARIRITVNGPDCHRHLGAEWFDSRAHRLGTGARLQCAASAATLDLE